MTLRPLLLPCPAALLHWLQLFTCASGTYLIGTERHFSHNNNLVISKMLDDQGGCVGPGACGVPVGGCFTGLRM